MGGQESIRGYLFQALITILDILESQNQWDEVEIEPDLESEKIDIFWTIWKNNKRIIKVQQIKSSINNIEKGSITKYLKDLDGSLTKIKNFDSESENYSELLLISPSYSEDQSYNSFISKVQWIDINTNFEQICITKIDNFLKHHQWEDKRTSYPNYDTEVIRKCWIGDLIEGSSDLFHRKLRHKEFKERFFRSAYVTIDSIKKYLPMPKNEQDALFNILEIFIRPGMIISIQNEQFVDMLMALEDIEFAIENGILRTRDSLPYSLSFPYTDFSPKIQKYLSEILELLKKAKKIPNRYDIKYDEIRIEIWKLVYQLILCLDTEKGESVKESFSNLAHTTHRSSIIRDLEHIDYIDLRKEYY